MKYCCGEHFWRDRQPCLKEQSDAQACVELLLYFLYSREVYRSSQQQFFNANFVWNQDEVSQNSRYAKRFYYSRQLSAQSGSCQTNQLRSSSLLLGTLSHGAHEPISVVLRTSFLDAPATMQHFDDSGHSFAKITIPYTIYLSLDLLAILAISVVLQICFDKKEIDKTIYTQKTSP